MRTGSTQNNAGRKGLLEASWSSALFRAETTQKTSVTSHFGQVAPDTFDSADMAQYHCAWAPFNKMVPPVFKEGLKQD